MPIKGRPPLIFSSQIRKKNRLAKDRGKYRSGPVSDNSYPDHMSTVTNLNKFRKQKARSEKLARASENAVKFGQSKPQKQRQKTLSDKMSKDLDGKKME